MSTREFQELRKLCRTGAKFHLGHRGKRRIDSRSYQIQEVACQAVFLIIEALADACRQKGKAFQKSLDMGIAIFALVQRQTPRGVGMLLGETDSGPLELPHLAVKVVLEVRHGLLCDLYQNLSISKPLGGKRQVLSAAQGGMDPQSFLPGIGDCHPAAF